MPPASKVLVRLADEQRDALEQLLRTSSCRVYANLTAVAP